MFSCNLVARLYILVNWPLAVYTRIIIGLQQPLSRHNYPSGKQLNRQKWIAFDVLIELNATLTINQGALLSYITKLPCFSEFLCMYLCNKKYVHNIIIFRIYMKNIYENNIYKIHKVVNSIINIWIDMSQCYNVST